MPLRVTRKMDLARGSKGFARFSSVERFENEVAPQSACRAWATSMLLPPRWRVHRWTPCASNFMRNMSLLPALVCPSRELHVLPATQALPTASTCANWSASHHIVNWCQLHVPLFQGMTEKSSELEWKQLNSDKAVSNFTSLSADNAVLAWTCTSYRLRYKEFWWNLHQVVLSVSCAQGKVSVGNFLSTVLIKSHQSSVSKPVYNDISCNLNKHA